MTDTNEMTDTRKSLVLDVLRNVVERECWDYCHEYGEPGYGDADTTAIVLGSYWVNTDDGLKDYFHRHPRFAQACKDAGVEFEWSDEWIVDHDYGKCYRTSGDCCGWTASYALTDDGEILTPDDDVESWIEYALGSDNRALNSRQVSRGDLESAGFTVWPDGDTFAESGWFPGQTDTPEGIAAAVRSSLGDDVEIISYVTGVGQFDVRWVTYVRAT